MEIMVWCLSETVRTYVNRHRCHMGFMDYAAQRAYSLGSPLASYGGPHKALWMV